MYKNVLVVHTFETKTEQQQVVQSKSKCKAKARLASDSANSASSSMAPYKKTVGKTGVFFLLL